MRKVNQQKSTNFRKNAWRASTSVAVIASALTVLPLAAHAQEDEPDADDDVIVVRGIRSSLEASVADKKSADAIVDTINAEDIGKFPDQNVAESLTRITGVQLDRGLDNGPSDNFGSGEGTQVSVRGIRPDLNLIRFNGAPVAPNTADRNFDFSVLSPTLVRRLYVHKSPTSDLQEGALGGVIDVEAHRAIDRKGFRVAGVAKYEFNDLIDGSGYRVSGFISNTFFDDKVGVLFSMNQQDIKNARHRYEASGWDGRPIGGVQGRIPVNFRYNNRRTEPNRTAYYGAIDFRPTDTLDFSVTYLNADNDTRDYGIQPILPAEIPQTALSNGVLTPGLFAGASAGTEDAYLSFDATGNNNYRRMLVLDRTFETPLETVTGKASWTPGNFALDLQYSHSEGSFFQDQFFIQFWGQDDFSIDYSDGNNRPLVTAGPGQLLFEDPSRYFINVANRLNRGFDTMLDDFAANAAYQFDDSPLARIKVGYRLTDQNHNAFRSQASSTPADRAGQTLDLYIDPANPLVEDAFSIGREGGVPSEFPNVDLDGITAYFDPIFQNFVVRPVDLPATYNINEKVDAAYVRFDFDLGRLKANGGVRYVHTSQDTLGFDQESGDPIDVSRSYQDWLPSFNAQYAFTDNFFLRAAYAKTMSRPPLQNLNPGGRVIALANRAIIGNPNLDPFRADQFDVSAEWYFDEESLFSVAYFHKNIESFILPEATTGIVPGFEDLGELDIETLVNGPGATINGIEVAVQDTFDFLPGLFSNFGTILNYTHIAAELDDGGEVPGISPNSFNAVLFWENDNFNIRAAYNWRDTYVAFPNFRGVDQFRDARGQLDLNAQYIINKNISVLAGVRNLTNEETFDYHGTPATPSTLHVSGAIYNAGIRFKF